MSTPAPLQILDVHKEFRRLRRHLVALDGVSLTVERGEAYGLLGPNGAGKTTLVKVCLGLSRPTRGQVRLRGLDPSHPAARLRVSYLPEGHRFPAYHTGVSALHFFGRLAGLEEATLRRRIPELLELVGLADRARDRIGRYSKGMTQRLGLAAALLDEPDLLFLDEPTDGVDPLGRRHIREVLLAARARGTTIFINSHLLSEVERTCDRVAILKDGRIVREGKVEALTRPALRFRLRLAQAPAWPLPVLPGVELAASNGHLEAAVADLESLNRLLDELRRQGGLIAELAPLGSDLEEVFVTLLKDESAAAPVATVGITGVRS
ncbi:MAG: ABC transporter ATP-binding protein [Acidobacteriota bacterium]|jgi:ABC-2 type transport system ATP-binding protein